MTGESVYVEPTPEERVAFQESIQGAANGVFLANMAIVSQARAVAYNTVFGKGLAKKGLNSIKRQQLLRSDKLGDRVMGRAWQGLSFTGNVLKSPLSEGFEEMAQGSVKHTALDYTMSKYDVLGKPEDNWSRFWQEGIGSLAQATGENLNKTFMFKDWDQTLEGIVGALLGAAGVPFNRRAYKRVNVKQPDGTERTELVRDPNESIWSGGVMKAMHEWRQGESNAANIEKVLRDKTADSVFEYVRNHPDIAPSLREMVPAMARMWGKQGEIEDALQRGSLKDAKSYEADLMHSYMTAHIRAGLHNQMVKELKATVDGMTNDQFIATFRPGEQMSDDAILMEKSEIKRKFEERAERTKEIIDKVQNVIPYQYGKDIDNSANEYFVYLASVAENRRERIEQVVSEAEQNGQNIRGMAEAFDVLKELSFLYKNRHDRNVKADEQGGLTKLFAIVQQAAQEKDPAKAQALNEEANAIKEALWMTESDFVRLKAAIHTARISPLAQELARFRKLEEAYAKSKSQEDKDLLYNHASKYKTLLTALTDVDDMQDELHAATEAYNHLTQPKNLSNVLKTIEERYDALQGQFEAKDAQDNNLPPTQQQEIPTNPPAGPTGPEAPAPAAPAPVAPTATDTTTETTDTTTDDDDIETPEGITAERVTSAIVEVLGPQLEEAGYKLEGEDIDQIEALAKEVADRKISTNEALRRIVKFLHDKVKARGKAEEESKEEDGGLDEETSKQYEKEYEAAIASLTTKALEDWGMIDEEDHKAITELAELLACGTINQSQAEEGLDKHYKSKYGEDSNDDGGSETETGDTTIEGRSETSEGASKTTTNESEVDRILRETDSWEKQYFDAAIDGRLYNDYDKPGYSKPRENTTFELRVSPNGNTGYLILEESGKRKVVRRPSFLEGAYSKQFLYNDGENTSDAVLTYSELTTVRKDAAGK
jgi:hypothetical protein